MPGFWILLRALTLGLRPLTLQASPNLSMSSALGVSDGGRVPNSSSRHTKDFLTVDCSSYKHVTMNWLALLLGIKGCACAAELAGTYEF